MPDAVVAAYAKEAGASYFNTSAKTGSGLEQAFLDIAKRVMEKQHEKAARNSDTGSLGKSTFARQPSVQPRAFVVQHKRLEKFQANFGPEPGPKQHNIIVSTAACIS